MKLIAIGGGGFTAETDRLLDDLVLSAAKGAATRFGFINTASDHDPVRAERFERLIAPRVSAAQVLSPLADAAELAEWLKPLDILYVGGGDTERLKTVWTERQYWPVFETAIARGLWVAGVSAGAVIWFEAALVRNHARRLELFQGAGLVAGSVCVHFSSESERAMPFSEAINAGSIPPGLAIDDGVAVVMDDDAPPYAVTARPGHSAYRVSRSGLIPLKSVEG